MPHPSRRRRRQLVSRVSSDLDDDFFDLVRIVQRERDRLADPVEFGEEFVKAYSGRQWIDKERTRLTDAIAKAEREQS